MNKGFTLVELLTAIFIIAVLSAIVLPSLNGMRERQRDTKRITDLKNLQVALERYFDRNGEYPDTGATYAVSGDASCYESPEGVSFSQSGLKELLAQNLISSLPSDPKNVNNYCYLYRKNYTCSGATRQNYYALLFKPENFDTFGGTSGGEYDTKNWHQNNNWLCLEP